MKPKMARERGRILRAGEEIIGQKVVNLDGEDIGEIQEVMIDALASRVTYAIVSFGGFLGIGDKLFAVPWVSLNHEEKKGVFKMKVNKELLENAPGFDRNHWPDMSDPTRISEIYKYYGSEPYWD